MFLPRRTPIALATSATLMLLSFAAQQAAAQTAAPAATAADAEKQESRAEASAPQTVTITATGRATTASKTPYNVSVLSAEALRESHITDAKKLISQSVGISAPENSARFADSVTVQGLNVSAVGANNLEFFVRSTLAYYLDDTPLPNIGYRIKDVTRVETLLGPQGTLYGAGSLGGTIRYITNQPRLGKSEASLNASVYQTKYGGLSSDIDGAFNVPLGSQLALRVALSTLDEKGYTDRVSNPPWRTGADAWSTKPNANQNVYANDDWQKVDGGRLSLLWQLNKDIKFTLSHAQQDQRANGTSAVSIQPLGVANARTAAERDAAWKDPNLDEGNSATTGLPCAPNCKYNDRFFTPVSVNDHTVISRFPEFANRKFRLSAFDIDWDLGFAHLHSSTSSFKDSRIGQADYASQGWSFYSPESPILGGFDLGGSITSDRSAYVGFDNTYKGSSHETRLTSKGDGPWNWIAGLYHTKQDRAFHFSEFIPGLNAYISGIGNGPADTTGLPDEGYREIISSQYKETALFGDLGYRITPQWLVSGGARVFKYDDNAQARLIDYAGGVVDADRSSTNGESGKSFYRFNTSFQFTPDLLGYATLSQGFRRGGTNPFRDRSSGGVTRFVREDLKRYEPDSTNNVELGVKGYVADRALYLEASVFQILWKNVQTYFSQDVSGFPVNGTTNGPDARSRGLNMLARYKLSPDWQLSYQGTTSQAEWANTKTVCLYDATASNGSTLTTAQQACRTWAEGGKLGGSAKWKHTLGARYTKLLENDMYLTANLSARHVGDVRTDRADSEAGNAGVRIFPAYTRVNASIGVERDAWGVQLWAENLADKRAIVSSQAGGIMGERIIYTQPRTLGMNLSYRF